MKGLNYSLLDEIILLFWDDSNNYKKENTQLKIGGQLFQEFHLVENLESFNSILDKNNSTQKYLFLIHLHHNQDNKGLHTFRNEKIKKYYPDLKYYLISSAPKKKIYTQPESEQMDVFSYDDYHNKIGDMLIPQTRYEMTGDNIKNDSSVSIIKKNGIFLSHSSKDYELVKNFNDLIINSGLSYDLDLVKFTSEEPIGIPGGINIPADLKDFINNKMGFFIQFISTNYLTSRVCLNEEGAAWCLLDDIMFLSILVPPCKSQDISWIKTTNKGIKINDKNSLFNLYQNRKQFFGEKVNITHLSQKIDEFLEILKNL